MYHCKWKKSKNCSFQCDEKHQIIEHHTQVHMKNINYECNQCGKKLSRVRFLNKHLWKEHGIKRSKCKLFHRALK